MESGTKSTDIQAGRINSFFGIIRAELSDYDATRVINRILNEYPDINRTEKCPNCNASMMAYWFMLDILDVLALIGMGNEVVRRKNNDRIDFTEANKIHVQSLSTLSYAMKSRTTQMRGLGLVKKLEINGKHIRGMWVITERGWVALRGEKVPKKVKVFRNRIIERSEEVITISEAIKVNADKVGNNKLGLEYKPSDFFGVDPQEGKIFRDSEVAVEQPAMFVVQPRNNNPYNNPY